MGFALVGCLDHFRALERPLNAAILFLIASTAFEFRYGAVGAFAWNRALYLLPFFLAGLVLTRFGWKWVVACAAIPLFVHQWEITIGALFGVAILALMPTVPLLARIGFFSYSIYLLHVFGTAGARIVMLHAGVDSIPLLLLVGTLAGIVLPIAADLVLARVPFLSRAILGVYSPLRARRRP
jgi:peptidoglycan/LPS O-acetylase OafA/YrhL